MNSFVEKLKFWSKDDESSGDEIFDKDATNLSHVGHAVHDVLRKHHNRHHHKMWNVTRGTVVDSVHQTPKHWDMTEDPTEEHSHWLPEKMGELIGRTEAWCDITSLGPPDGKFMKCFKAGLATLAEKSKGKDKRVVVRMMFGNIPGMPVNCTAVIKALTEDLPSDANLYLWVGAWRKGFSWNHSKMITVDGVYLHTGGHNLWDKHYLTNNPVHDLSVEFIGSVARDSHRFADQQWGFVERKQKTCVGSFVDMLPDGLPLVLKTRVTVSEWPEGVATIFPPQFSREVVAGLLNQERSKENDVPLISIGRQGKMVFKSRPSDDAILAMINSSRNIIRMTLQDIGPVCIPGSKKSLPGLKWPKAYLAAIGKAIYERGVDVEIVLSNPNSIPGGLKGTEANYGNGWDCVDVAAEIIKRIQKQYTTIDDEKLRTMITENLRICFVRHDKKSNYADGKSIGLHSKHFIIDDTCCYIGSQNLYMCDLAEWGIVIDSEVEVKKIKEDYFAPMWKNSFTGEDVDVQKVMDGLKIDRNGHNKIFNGVQNEEAAMALMPYGGGDFYDVKDRIAIEVEDGETHVVGENREATAPASESKDNSEAALPCFTKPTFEPDVAAGSVSPVNSNEQGDVIKEKSADLSKEEKKSETESEANYPDYSKTENEEQVEKLKFDCNWCGITEVLSINK